MRVIGGCAALDPRDALAVDDVLPMIRGRRADAVDVTAAGPVALFDTTAPVTVSADRNVWLAANVDLTNMIELQRQTGQASGEQALLALYEAKGPAFIDDLEGAFSLALWDLRHRRLLLAVDRFGMTRLYYASSPRHVTFASRADTLTAMPGLDGSVSPAAVLRYLNFGYVPAPDSIYRGIRRLPPGHLLTVQDGVTSLQRYWDLRFSERTRSPRATAEETYRQTEAAVQRILDGAPVKTTGAFLSGGTDSSTIVGLMSRLTGERVNAFSIGFSDERYNELPYAELVARHFDANHYTHTIDAREALELLPHLVDAYDEPFGNDSMIGTALCARVAAECGMKRLLAGDGGDEIFGGNERYRVEAILGVYQHVPRNVRRVVEPAMFALRASNRSIVTRAQRYVTRSNIPNPRRFYSYEFFLAQQAQEFLAPDLIAAAGEAPFDVLDAHWTQCADAADLNRLLYLDMKLTIGDNDLYKVTRTAEFAGMLVAFPMLDPTLVSFMATVPTRDKVRGFEKRHLFKQTFRPLLPPATLSKRKHGFGVPTSAWLRSDPGFRALAHDALRGRSAHTTQWFRPGAIERLFQLHEDDATSFYGGQLWKLLMLELWHRGHAAGRSGA